MTHTLSSEEWSENQLPHPTAKPLTDSSEPDASVKPSWSIEKIEQPDSPVVLEPPFLDRFFEGADEQPVSSKIVDRRRRRHAWHQRISRQPIRSAKTFDSERKSWLTKEGVGGYPGNCNISPAQKSKPRIARRSKGSSQFPVPVATIDLPKIMDAGEDAPPIAITTPDGCHGLLAVCDGMGGAGSRTASLDGIERSEAWHAARLASSSIVSWASSQVFSFKNPDLDALDAKLNGSFRAASSQLPKRSSALKSKMIRALPTTLALALWSKRDDDLVDVEVAWLGDSRVYGLSPQEGLFQITSDDAQGRPDAFKSLRDDPPLTRCVTADEVTKLHRGRVVLTGPVVLFAASDGFFGYVRSPLHLEEELLKALKEGTDWNDFISRLKTFAKRTAADDVSVAMALLGSGFAECQGSFEGTIEDHLHEMQHLEVLASQARQLIELGRQATELAETSLERAWNRKVERYYRHTIGEGAL